MSNRRLALALLASSLVLAACDSTDSGSPTLPPQGLDSQTVARQRLLDDLFAPATFAETTLVASQWLERIPSADGARWEDSGRVAVQLPSFATLLGFPESWTLPDSFLSPGVPTRPFDSVHVRILSHVVDGFRHQGVLWTPTGPARLPILVFSHGGDDGIDSAQWSAVLQATKAFRDSIAILAPSFRSEPVGVLSRPVSEGGPSPWDRDVEDLRSLVRSAAALDSRLDTTNVCLVGYSRGGGVALLAAARDSLFTCLATVAAPTAFQGPWVRALSDSILRGRPVDLPGLDHLSETVLLPYREGRIPLDSARRELVRRSAVRWARRLPTNAVFFHGYVDQLVPSEELDRLQVALQVLGRTPDTRRTNHDHYRIVAPALLQIAPFVHDNLLP